MTTKEDVLTRIGKFSLEKIEDKGDFIVACAMEIAQVMCGQDLQFVTMEIFKLKKRGAYRITFGMPQDSIRHGIGEVGLLEEPVKKEALICAIQDNLPVVVNDVLSSPLTEYMRVHALNKDIERLVILPISFNHSQWLLVFDRLRGGEKFSSDDEEFLKRSKILIEKALWAQEEVQSARAKDVLEQSSFFVRGIKDAFRNPLSTAFLAAERAKKELGNGADKEATLRWLEVAQESIKKAMEQISLLGIIQNCSEEKGGVLGLEYVLEKFQQQQPKEASLGTFNLNQGSLEEIFITIKNLPALEGFFSELNRYLTKGKERISLSVEEGEKKRIVFSVEAPCFFPDKEKKELELLIICNLAKIAGARTKTKKGKLEVSFPLANGG